jgi:hypothetical protein
VRAIIDFLSPHGFPEVLKVPFQPIKILLATRTSDNSDYTIPGYPLRRASQTVQKLFEVTLLYLYCRREKTIKGGNFL